MAARYLGLDEAAWSRQPWWVQRTYIDGFVEEELLEFQGAGAPPRQGPDSKFEVPQADPVTANDAALRRMGLRVIDGG